MPYNDFEPRNRCYIEVVRSCNAMCTWCDTGMRKRHILPQYNTNSKIMDAVAFSKLLTCLIEKNVILKQTIVFPYNYGEPFLHPKFDLILHALEAFKLRYWLSTNGSIPLKLPKNTRLEHLEQLVFSMPGFSQASYDKIHQLDFEAVKQNIAGTLRQVRAAGFTGLAEISYHRYRFSEDELPLALAFAYENGMRVRSNLASVLSVDIGCDFMEGKLNQDILARMREDINVAGHVEAASQKPDDFACSALQTLTITTDFNLCQCCWVHEEAPGNKLGDIRGMTWAEIKAARAEARNTFCARCRSCRADAFMAGWPETSIHQQEQAAPPAGNAGGNFAGHRERKAL